MRPSPTLSTSDARRPFFALGDMDEVCGRETRSEYLTPAYIRRSISGAAPVEVRGYMAPGFAGNGV
jgi:hypothetical protein